MLSICYGSGNELSILVDPEDKITIWPSSSILGHILWEKYNSKRYMRPSGYYSTVSRTWKQPKCSWTEEWIKKWYAYTMEYYSAVKKNELVPFAEIQMDLDTIIQSKSEKEKQVLCIDAYMWNLEKCYRWTYLQSRNKDIDLENKHMDTKVGNGELRWIRRLGLTYIHAAAAKSLQSCPTLCNPIDSSPTGSPVPGILQARTLEWAAISFSKALKVKSESEVAQLCPTLHNPMDCIPPDFSIHGMFQARVLERVAIGIGTLYLCYYA